MKKTLAFLAAGALSVSCDRQDDFVGGGSPDSTTPKFLKITSFSNGSGSEGYAEINAFDAITNRLFIVNPVEMEVSVWNLADPTSPFEETSIPLPSPPNSVAVAEGLLAGALPDMVTFSPNDKYIVSANEGDARDYADFSEEVREADLNLDETVYPYAAELQKEENLGRLKVTAANGGTDGDGKIDQIYGYGGRFNPDSYRNISKPSP